MYFIMFDFVSGMHAKTTDKGAFTWNLFPTNITMVWFVSYVDAEMLLDFFHQLKTSVTYFIIACFFSSVGEKAFLFLFS